MTKCNKLWVSWEDHRRSRELAKALNFEYVPLTLDGSRYRKYPILIMRTISLLFKNKPKVVICQNPSIVLASLLCLFKKIFNFKLIVDRHTNFKFSTLKSLHPKWVLFHLLSKLTIKVADLTIVTNDPLKDIVDSWGGKGFVLQDKLPQLDKGDKVKLDGVVNIAFVCTFSEDEPYEKIINVFNDLSSDTHLYVTGNYTKWAAYSKGAVQIPDNVHLLGFIDEIEYQSLIKSVDTVMVITDLEYVLNCGSYEAISADKSMILSDTVTIRSYFSFGATYSKLDSDGLKKSIIKAIEQRNLLSEEIVRFKPLMIKQWDERRIELENIIKSFL